LSSLSGKTTGRPRHWAKGILLGMLDMRTDVDRGVFRDGPNRPPTARPRSSCAKPRAATAKAMAAFSSFSPRLTGVARRLGDAAGPGALASAVAAACPAPFGLGSPSPGPSSYGRGVPAPRSAGCRAWLVRRPWGAGGRPCRLAFRPPLLGAAGWAARSYPQTLRQHIHALSACSAASRHGPAAGPSVPGGASASPVGHMTERSKGWMEVARRLTSPSGHCPVQADYIATCLASRS